VPGEFSVIWNVPMRGDLRLSLTPSFSSQTQKLGPVVARQAAGAFTETWRLKTVEPLGRGLIKIEGLEKTMTDALVRIEFRGGGVWIKRLTPQEPSAVIPPRANGWQVAGEYSKLGVEHILTGIDHLLFVFALLLITKGGWKIVKTVSAFSLSHCLTLAAATLGWVHVPQKPVEAIIALSIVFVALEAVQAHRGQVGLAQRAPWIVAFSFGLLHGLGFAGALSEIGLPPGHIPTALLFFSAGVEAGHLLFVGAVLSAAALLRRVRLSLPNWMRFFPGYSIGVVAMFWLIERVSQF
jgi:hydrogenase/urease accessory protein HupE